MIVLKFGGGVLRIPNDLIQACKILKSYSKAVLVVSAFGKMTSAFEELARAFFKQEDTQSHLYIYENFMPNWLVNYLLRKLLFFKK